LREAIIDGGEPTGYSHDLVSQRIVVIRAWHRKSVDDVKVQVGLNKTA
jgi:hypothetical protein